MIRVLSIDKHILSLSSEISVFFSKSYISISRSIKWRSYIKWPGASTSTCVPLTGALRLSVPLPRTVLLLISTALHRGPATMSLLRSRHSYTAWQRSQAIVVTWSCLPLTQAPGHCATLIRTFCTNLAPPEGINAARSFLPHFQALWELISNIFKYRQMEKAARKENLSPFSLRFRKTKQYNWEEVHEILSDSGGSF